MGRYVLLIEQQWGLHANAGCDKKSDEASLVEKQWLCVIRDPRRGPDGEVSRLDYCVGMRRCGGGYVVTSALHEHT